MHRHGIRKRRPLTVNIRPLRPADRQAIVDLYNHYIETSACTFDLVPHTRDKRATWFGQFDGHRKRCLVADLDGEVVGYANSAQFRPKAAYDTSVEVSIYTHHAHHGKGIGRLLYSALFEALSDTGVHRAYAGITLPNAASVQLHSQFGFEPCGLFEQVGFKFDRFWDVGWYVRDCSSKTSQ